MDTIKMRVLNRYRGAESSQFDDGAVPAGAIINVSPERSRQLIANGNAVPLAGPSETKDGVSPEKKELGGTAGSAVPPSSSPVDQASPKLTARQQRAANKKTAGKS